jgi:L-fucose mutarotase
MLKGIDKILTGDLLKILCDMGHGDELVIADANFPAETCAQRLIRLPGIDGVRAAQAILSVLPLDTYCDDPAVVMALTESDVKKGMRRPAIWDDYQSAAGHLTELERFAFYERAKKAYAVVATGEERQYGNLILVKGVVL